MKAILVCVCTVATGSIIVGSTTINSMEINGVKISGRWQASSPTIKSSEGEYLAYDGTGKVYMSREKASWAFVNLKWFVKHKGMTTVSGRGPVAIEEIGYTLSLQATDGPMARWYLARAKDGALMLRKEPREAATLTFVLKEQQVISR